MNILVIKQTSLGDVLHSTGHVRAIRQSYPNSRITLLTANSSADIYRHNSNIDRIILVDRHKVKANWWRRPRWSYQHMRDVLMEVRDTRYDLAFDLQGLAKTVLFLYGAKADKKFVKGKWMGLSGFRDKTMHALDEMDEVLKVAGISGIDTTMELVTSNAEVSRIDNLLEQLNQQARPVAVLSPFSRWPSKDWPLDHFVQIARELISSHLVTITGAPDRAAEIDAQIRGLDSPWVVNLADKISVLEFAELVRRADFMLTGDSFPMHVAVACKTPVLALFAPTDQKRVGPRQAQAEIMIAPDCRRCDRRDCPRQCLTKLTPQEVLLNLPMNVTGV